VESRLDTNYIPNDVLCYSILIPHSALYCPMNNTINKSLHFNI